MEKIKLSRSSKLAGIDSWQAAWRLAKSSLQAGQVIVCPTDTLYGFSALARQSSAIKKIYHLKRRTAKSGAIILVSSLSMLKRYAFVSRAQEAWLKQVWPGRVSVIVKSRKNLPASLLGPDDSLAARLPKNDWLVKLIKDLGEPLISTSLNPSGQPPLTRVDNLTKYFSAKQLSLVIDVGELKGKASRLVDLKNYPQVEILRK